MNAADGFSISLRNELEMLEELGQDDLTVYYQKKKRSIT